jgi:MFS family permease
MVARFLPSVVVGPLSGVVADRFNRRTIMIVSDLLRAVVVLGFLFVRRPDQIWIIYVLTVLQLTFSTFFEPAKSAAVPSIVAESELVTANAIASVTWSTMLTLGAAAGGLVTGWFGTDAAFVVDSLTYLVSAALIARVRFPHRPPREKTKLTLSKALGITDTLDGIRYVSKRPCVLALMVLYAARGIGTALGPVFARRLAGDNRARMQTTIGLSFLVGGIFYAAFGGATNYVLAISMLMIAHMGGSILWVFSTVLLQTSVEDNFRGRVFAAELALLTLTMAASNYAVGELLDRFNFSPRAVTVGIGILFLLPGFLWFATARWWNRENRSSLHSKPPALGASSITNEVALRDAAAKIHLSSD